MADGGFEQRVQAILEELPIGTCIFRAYEDDDAQTTYLFIGANRGFYDCIEYTPQEFFEKGNSFEKIILREERKRLLEKMQQATEYPGENVTDTFQMLLQNGQICTISWNTKYLVDKSGAGYLISCCSRFDEWTKQQVQLLDKLSREKQEKRQLKDLIYELPVGVAVIKGGHDIVIDTANVGYAREQGYTVAELLEHQEPFTASIYPEDLDHFEDALESCREQKNIMRMEIRMVSRDKEIRWKYVQCQLYYYKNATPYYILTVWDIDERRQLEDELRLMDEQYRMLEEVSDEFPLDYDVSMERFRIPQKYYQNGKIKNKKRKYMDAVEMLNDIFSDDREEFAKALLNASEQETSGIVDYRQNMAAEGETPKYVWYRTIYRSILDGTGRIKRIIGRSYDISYDRKIQEELSQEMRRDPLTRLLNKVAVSEEVERMLKEQPQGEHALFVIDIDNFKRINDTFGHTVGDTVISDTAQAIGGMFRKQDVVGRVGGDEFLAFMNNVTPEVMVAKAKQLCKEISRKIIGDENEVTVTLSIGLAVYPADGKDYETLFKMADQAMYDTKKSGKNNYSFAQKGRMICGNSREAKEMENSYLRTQEADREFLNLAFNLLSHARDVNGSLNVLLEQIGKKYGLHMVSVFEYADEKPEMTMTNSWSRHGQQSTQEVLPRTIREFKEAQIGEFVVITSESMEKQNPKFWENWNCIENQISHIAGSKFEIAGKHSGCLYVGIRRKAEGFNESEKITLCELSRIVAVFVRLRNRMQDDQNKIKNLQNQDKLTGLYNYDAFRRVCMELIPEMNAKEPIERPCAMYALVCVDINKFSFINENFGQAMGDEILIQLAAMMENESQVVAACHMYSDFFVELIGGESRAEICQTAMNLNQQFEEMQQKKYPAGSMHLSAGVCFIDQMGKSFETILEGANLARKQAKEKKCSSVVIYQEDMRERRNDEIHITGRFYAAMQKGELELFLQPKFLLKEQKIYSAEALARWRTSSGELLMPGRFIPPLESLGYITDLDFYILEQLLRTMKRWRESGRELFTISTNFSRKNFQNGGRQFVERLQEMMGRYGIEPKYIEIEVTESAIVENLTELQECLNKLEQLGFRIAIDDFGTGYSSLSVLLEIPADVIKIDKKFTERIDIKEQRDFVVNMGQFIKSAKEEVIFEGIEKPEQREFLLDCGFRYGQGYLFDKPLSVDEFERKYI